MADVDRSDEGSVPFVQFAVELDRFLGFGDEADDRLLLGLDNGRNEQGNHEQSEVNHPSHDANLRDSVARIVAAPPGGFKQGKALTTPATISEASPGSGEDTPCGR